MLLQMIGRRGSGACLPGTVRALQQRATAVHADNPGRLTVTGGRPCTVARVAPLVVPVPESALTGFALELARVEDTTWEMWPRDSDGRPLDGSVTDTVDLGAPFGGHLEATVITLDGADPYWAFTGATGWLQHEFATSPWPRSAHPAAGPDDRVLPVADLDRARAELAGWAQALTQMPFRPEDLARAQAAHAALVAALPVPSAEPAKAALPSLPETAAGFDTDRLGAVLAALRTFAAANIVSHRVHSHGKSWEPFATVSVRRAGHWSLTVHSYQFSELARAASACNGTPRTVLAGAERLATAAVDDIAALFADPEMADDCADVPGVPVTLADGESVAPIPAIDELAAALVALAEAGCPAAVGFGPCGTWEIDVPRLRVQVVLDAAESTDGCTGELARLLALATEVA